MQRIAPPLLAILALTSTSLLLHSQRNHVAYVLRPHIWGFPSHGPACPWPDRVPGPVDHAAQRCDSLPSRLPEFDVQICRGLKDCGSFTLRIRRTNAEQCRAAGSHWDLLSDEKSWERWMLHEKGPDAFSLRTDGAQKYADHRAIHEGNCSYRFDVALQNSGTLYLESTYYYRQYTAYNDHNEGWPELLDLPLFDRPIQLDLCPASCPTYIPPISNISRAVYHHEQPVTAILPMCTNRQDVSGIYVPMHPLDAISPPVPYPEGHNGSVHGRYRFVPTGCRYNHDGLLHRDPRRCTTQPRKALFIGDSHARVLCDATVHRLSGHVNMLLESEKVGMKTHTIGAVEAECVWDVRLETATTWGELATRLNGVDVLVASVGAHFVSTVQLLHGMGHFIRLVDDCAIQGIKMPKRKIFVSTPAATPRTDNYVRLYKDRRTNLRMWWYAHATMEMAREHGWTVIDQFAMTEPFTMEVMKLDRAHFLATDAIDPLVDEVLGKSGLCGETDEYSGLA